MIVELLFLVLLITMYLLSLLEEQRAIEIHQEFARFHKGCAK